MARYFAIIAVSVDADSANEASEYVDEIAETIVEAAQGTSAQDVILEAWQDGIPEYDESQDTAEDVTE